MTDPRDEGLPLPRYVPGADQRANLREVAPGLYVGGMIAVCERPTQTRDWWAVVDCHGYRVDGQREVRFGTLPRVVRYGFDDCGPVPASLLAAASALYRERGGDVLVCCAAGSSRSAAVAYAMMRDVLGMPHDDALARVSQRGGGPHPATLASAKAWVGRMAWHVIHLREGLAAIAPRCQCGQIALHESVVIGGVAPLRVCDGAVCFAVARAAGTTPRRTASRRRARTPT